MKILFTFGGLPHYLNPILSKLNSIENIELVVVVPKKHYNTLGDGVKQSTSNINFEIIYLEEKKAFYGKHYFKNLDKTIIDKKIDIVVTIWPYILNFVFNFKLQKLIKENKIRLIIKEIPFDIPSYKNTFSYYKSDYALRLNEDLIKKTINPLTFYPKHWVLRKIRKFYYSKLISASVCYTNEGIEIASSYGLKKENIFVSSNSPDTEIMYKAKKALELKDTILPLNLNPHSILHVGRLVKWKRVDLIIEAVELLVPDFPNIELVIVGNGKERKNLEELVKNKKLEDNIMFAGGVYDDIELGNHFRSSAIYVLAGMGGLSINQAMLFEKPVICSIADGTEKQLVRDKYNGLFFENGNAKDLSDKIKILFNNKDKVLKYGKNSAYIIKNEINENTVLKAYISAFNTVLKVR